MAQQFMITLQNFWELEIPFSEIENVDSLEGKKCAIIGYYKKGEKGKLKEAVVSMGGKATVAVSGKTDIAVIPDKRAYTDDVIKVIEKIMQGNDIRLYRASEFRKMISENVTTELLAEFSEERRKFNSKEDNFGIIDLKGATSIKAGEFKNIFLLNQLYIPDTVQSIGDAAFMGCTELRNVRFPAGIRKTGDNAFWGCGRLTGVKLPEGLKEISYGTFNGCYSLEEIRIPNAVDTIGEKAFWGCGSLTGVELPEGLKEISDETFYDCRSLEEIRIPNTVDTIGESAFAWCGRLKRFRFPSGVRETGAYMFSNCDNLAEVELPEGLKKVSKGTFIGCENLKQITIPASVEYIDEGAFCHSGIENLDIPEGCNVHRCAIKTYEELLPTEIPEGTRLLDEISPYHIDQLDIPESVEEIAPLIIHHDVAYTKMFSPVKAGFDPSDVSDVEKEAIFILNNSAVKYQSWSRGERTLDIQRKGSPGIHTKIIIPEFPDLMEWKHVGFDCYNFSAESFIANYIYILTKLLSAKTDREFICLSNFFEQNKKLIDIMAKRFQSDLGCDEKLLEEIRRLASSTGVAEYIESGYSDTVVAVAERPAESSIRSGGPFQRIETPDIYFKDSIEYIYFSDGGKELQAIHYRKLVTRWNEKYSKYIGSPEGIAGFAGKTVVVHNAYYDAKKATEALKEYLKQSGAVVRDSVSGSTDCLIVTPGCYESRSFLKAIELKEKHSGLKIFYFNDVLDALGI